MGRLRQRRVRRRGREIPLKFRELIALAVGITTQCTYCIDSHAQKAVRAGATEAELAETAWVATAIRAGGGFAHGRLAFKLAEDAVVPRTSTDRRRATGGLLQAAAGVQDAARVEQFADARLQRVDVGPELPSPPTRA